MKRLAWLTPVCLTLSLLVVPPASAQFLAGSDVPTVEEQQLEEDYIRTREEHAAGHIPDYQMAALAMAAPMRAPPERRTLRQRLSFSLISSG